MESRLDLKDLKNMYWKSAIDWQVDVDFHWIKVLLIGILQSWHLIKKMFIKICQNVMCLFRIHAFFDLFLIWDSGDQFKEKKMIRKVLASAYTVVLANSKKNKYGR